MSINSLGYAGMFLVKSEEEAEAVIREGIVTMLRYVAILFAYCYFVRRSTTNELEIFESTGMIHRHTCRGVGVPRMADDSLAEPQNKDDID